MTAPQHINNAARRDRRALQGEDGARGEGRSPSPRFTPLPRGNLVFTGYCDAEGGQGGMVAREARQNFEMSGLLHCVRNDGVC